MKCFQSIFNGVMFLLLSDVILVDFIFIFRFFIISIIIFWDNFHLVSFMLLKNYFFD